MKLVFHLPSYCIHENEVWACANYNFKRELVEAFAKAGNDYFYLIPAKKFLGGIEFPFEMLVVYDTEDSGCLYTDIFIELVCKYHSELKQECYYYERGDVLVNVRIGGCEDESC